MRRGITCTLLIFGCLVVWPGFVHGADDGESDPSKEPMFVRWLVSGDPDDETIRHYWERAKRDELSAEELADLGTMLFERGYPKDAVRMYRAALDLDRDLYEAWFRIGLVLHRDGELEDARRAYKKCLKKLIGHGWCNFYLGLLEEQTDHPSKALEHYRRAFKVAPELADPRVNPEVLSSKLQFAAAVRHGERERFTGGLPMTYLNPSEVRSVREQFEPTPTPTPTVTATPIATPTPPRAIRRVATPAIEAGRDEKRTGEPGGTPESRSNGRVRSRPPREPRRTATPYAPRDGKTPYGIRQPRDPGGSTTPTVGTTSPEASLAPWWLEPPKWLLALL